MKPLALSIFLGLSLLSVQAQTTIQRRVDLIKNPSTANLLVAQAPQTSTRPDDDLGNTVVLEEGKAKPTPEPLLYVNLDTYATAESNFSRSREAIPNAFGGGALGVYSFPKIAPQTRLILAANYGLNRGLVSTDKISASAFGSNALGLTVGGLYALDEYVFTLTYTFLRFTDQIAGQEILSNSLIQLGVNRSFRLGEPFTLIAGFNSNINASSSRDFSRWENLLGVRLIGQWTPGFSSTLGLKTGLVSFSNSRLDRSDLLISGPGGLITNPNPRSIQRSDYRTDITFNTALQLTEGLVGRVDIGYTINGSNENVSAFNNVTLLFGLSYTLPVYATP